MQLLRLPFKAREVTSPLSCLETRVILSTLLICRVYGFQGIDADFTSEKHRAAAGNP